MVKFFEEIPAYLIPWIQQQKIFWVATAPLSPDGHVNVSPKGVEGTFHVENEKRVRYEDLTGSGIETIAHIKENSRITVMLTALEGPPRTVRIFGRGATYSPVWLAIRPWRRTLTIPKGTVYEFGSAEYEALIPIDKRQPGSRSVIALDVQKVGTSDGFSIPLFTFKCNRTKLHTLSSRCERVDIDAEASSTIPNASPTNDTNTNPDTPTVPNLESSLPEEGLKSYWKNKNKESIDGLPGITEAYRSRSRFSDVTTKKNWVADDERLPGNSLASNFTMRQTGIVDERALAGFIAGVVVTVFLSRFSHLVLTLIHLGN